MLKMSADLADRDQAIRQRARDMEAPDFKGLAPDVRIATEQFLNAKQEAIDLFSSGNPNLVMNSPEAKAVYRKLAEAGSPVVKQALEQEQTFFNDYKKRVEGMKHGDGQGLLFTDANGVPMRDPDDETKFLDASKAMLYRSNLPQYALQNGGAAMNFEGAVPASPTDYQKELYEGFKASGSTAQESTGDYGQLQAMANSAMNSDRLIASVVLHQKYENNVDQINAGIASEVMNMDSRKRAALLNAYTQTDSFIKGTTPSKEKGDGKGRFLKDGKVDAQLVYQGMFSDPEYDHALPKMGKGKTSFANAFIETTAARALDMKTTYDPKLMKLGSHPSGSGSGDSTGKINYFAHMDYMGAETVTDPATGMRRPAMEPREATIAFKRPDGTAYGMKVESQRSLMPPSIHDQLTRFLGLHDQANGNPVPESSLPLVKDVFSGLKGFKPGGMEQDLSENNESVLVRVSNELVFLPVKPKEGGGKLVDGEGQNVSKPYLVATIRTKDEGPDMTDFIDEVDDDGVSRLKEVSISSDEYRDRYPGRVGGGSGSGNYSEAWHDIGGVKATDVEVLIPVPIGVMTDPYTRFKHDPNNAASLINPEREARAYYEQVRDTAIPATRRADTPATRNYRETLNSLGIPMR